MSIAEVATSAWGLEPPVRYDHMRSPYAAAEYEDAEVIVLARNSTLHLPERIVSALGRSSSDWRTVQSLAAELRVSETAVREAIASLGLRVRTPVRPKPNEVDWIRLHGRGMTWGERTRVFLAILGRVDYR